MHTPMQRIGEPHEIAGAAVFLASPASTFMTGQAIVVDGGSTRGWGCESSPHCGASCESRSASPRVQRLDSRFRRNDGGGSE